MAYSKGILERFAQSIPEDDLREEFKAKIGGIEFDASEGKEMCSAGQVEEVVRGTRVEHLAKVLGRDFMKFLSPEDLGQ